MFKQNQTIYYIDQEDNINKGIYKGEVNAFPCKSISHIYSEKDGNILINSDYVFSKKKDAKNIL